MKKLIIPILLFSGSLVMAQEESQEKIQETLMETEQKNMLMQKSPIAVMNVTESAKPRSISAIKV